MIVRTYDGEGLLSYHSGASVIKFSQWYLSVFTLFAYLGLFAYWKEYPSRVAFVFGGLFTAALLSMAVTWAQRRGYFCNRLDLILHGYVILDVILEGLAYEFFLACWNADSLASSSVNQFHNNDNFYGCAALFALVVGGHRFACLHNRDVTDTHDLAETVSR